MLRPPFEIHSTRESATVGDLERGRCEYPRFSARGDYRSVLRAAEEFNLNSSKCKIY